MTSLRAISAPNPLSDSNYQMVDELTTSHLLEPLVLKTLKGERVSFLFEHDVSGHELHTLKTIVSSQWNCRECGIRAYKFGKLSDKNGPVFFSKALLEKTTPFHGDDHAIYKNISSICEDYSQRSITDLHLLRDARVCLYDKMAGGFTHWQLLVDTPSELTDERAELIRAACHRYLPADLPNLVNKMLGDGTFSDAILSLNLMEKCLHAATYGDKFLPALTWFRNIFIDLQSLCDATSKDCSHAIRIDCSHAIRMLSHRDRWSFFAKHLLLSPISAELHGAACSFFHTANNNIVDMLGIAKTEEEMTTLIEERLNPLNYRRRDTTTELSDSEVKIAMKELGEFTNTILTTEEASRLPHAVMTVQTTQVEGSMSAFNKMMGKKTDNVINSPSGFAARIGVTSLQQKITSLNTIDGLLEFLKEHPNTKLEVNCGPSSNVVYLAKTTLREEARSVPHFWAFVYGSVSTKYGFNGWMEVAVVAPMYKYIYNYNNVAFIMKSVKTAPTGNCCFSEFLSSKYTRVCGKAFERLNTLTNITVPEVPAIGVGISGQNVTGTTTPISLRLDGTVITISKLF